MVSVKREARHKHLANTLGIADPGEQSSSQFHYYGAVRPWPAHQYFRPRGWAACAFSLCSVDQVLKFHARAQMSVKPPIHRTPYGQ